MKKLYAKASFKSKKPANNNSNNNKTDQVSQNCDDIYITNKPQQQQQHGSIILAYQSDGYAYQQQQQQQQQQQPHPADMMTGNGNVNVSTATMRKIQKRPTPASAAANASEVALVGGGENETIFPPPPSRTPTNNSLTPSPLSASNPSLAAARSPAHHHSLVHYPAADDAHYYYSIQELQQLNMLDHRHPDFHRQSQHQLLRQSKSATPATTTTSAAPSSSSSSFPSFYEHHRLVLQLPMAGAALAAPGMSNTTAPIYEAPQMCNATAAAAEEEDVEERCFGARSLDFDYNGHPRRSRTLPPPSAFAAGLLGDRNLNDNFDDDNDADNVDGRTAAGGGFGSLPIVDAGGNEEPHSLALANASSLSFNKLRKLQHTNSMPSIRMKNDRSDGGAASSDDFDDNADNDENNGDADVDQNARSGVGGLQQLHLYRLQQQRLANNKQQQQQQQQQQYQQQHHPRQATTRHNSVKVNLINNWRMSTANAAAGNAANGNVEQSIIGARASVMVYDDNQKRWLPSGTSSGLSKVQIYHHQQNNTFRIVGRKLQDHEVVINCSILKGLKYNQATPTFHQWRDSKSVYGLNFSSQGDADAFARAMVHALDVLSGRLVNNHVMGGAMGMGVGVGVGGVVAIGGPPTNGNGYAEEDMGYRTMTSEDAAILRQQQQITGQITPSAQTPTSQTNQNNIPQSPPTPQGHHRTSRNSLSAPAAPQPQQMTMPQQHQQQQQQQPPYGHTNGLQSQPQHIPPAPPGQGQPQYHAPQQMQNAAAQGAHAVYAAQQQHQQQQLVNAGYPPQAQYQPSHFMLSNSNPNLNLHQYSQQQQQQPPQSAIPNAPQPPMPPPHQNGIGGSAGAGVGGIPIYVSASQSQPVLPTSHSSSSNNGGGGIYGGPPMPMQQQQQQQQQQQPQSTPVMQNGIGGAGSGGAAAPPPPPPPPFGGIGGGGGGPPAPPMMGGAVPPAPMPPPAANINRSAPPAPAAPPPPPTGAAAPPPPPPPPAGGAPASSSSSSSAKKDDPQADLMGSLAAQLQQAKLKKNKPSAAITENSGSSTSSAGSGNYGTIGRSSSGMASMMDEMAKTLARRRAQAEKKPDAEPEVKQRPWEKSNTLPHKLGGSSSSNTNCNAATNNNNNTSNSGSESPRPMRKRFGSASEETILKVNGDGLSLALSSTELDTLKADILKEIRVEIHKVKQEIIEVIKSEFNRR